MTTQFPQRKRVLFVDDESSVLDGLRRSLHGKRREWDMAFATGVDTALEMLEARDFDTVVSDIDMPVRDGFDLLRTIRAREAWKGIPVVILTGNGESGLKRQALDLGATDLLNKPVDSDDLVARIGSVLRLKSYDDEIRAQNHALERKVQERTAQLERAQAELIWRLGKAGEFRDSDTGYHVVRVGFYAREIALEMGLDIEFQRSVFLTAPLHDIGKIGIPDHVLLKPGPLTPEEWAIMKKHSSIGAQILRDEMVAGEQILRLGIVADLGVMPVENPLTLMAARIAEGHHERWDGSGYPHGLAGDDIPLEARITALADVFDALHSKRPYKEAFPEEHVMEIMRNGRGTQFDPVAFDAFLEAQNALQEIRKEFDDSKLETSHADDAQAIRDLREAA